jgi:hypothetical protein
MTSRTSSTPRRLEAAAAYNGRHPQAPVELGPPGPDGLALANIASGVKNIIDTFGLLPFFHEEEISE